MSNRLWAVFLALSGLLWLVSGPAMAQAELRTAVPAPGAVLSESPSQVVLTFSEAVTSGTIELLAADSGRVAPVVMVADEAAERLVADLPELPVGVYTVQWAVVSLDGQAAAGNYAFEVREDAGNMLATGLYWGIGLFVLGILWLQLRRIRQREDRAYGL